jgi:hypothetical protein
VKNVDFLPCVYTHLRVSANVNSFLSAPGAQRRTLMRESAIVNNFLYAPNAQAADALARKRKRQ